MSLNAETQEAADRASTFSHLSLAALVMVALSTPGPRAWMLLAVAALLEGFACFYSARVTRLCRWHYCLFALKHGGEHTAMALRLEYAALWALEREGLVSSQREYDAGSMERGGRPRYWYRITPAGLAALEGA